jgi:hypothetical protein
MMSTAIQDSTDDRGVPHRAAPSGVRFVIFAFRRSGSWWRDESGRKRYCLVLVDADEYHSSCCATSLLQGVRSKARQAAGTQLTS